ncbi:serine hydrolase domain-containing protein [Pelagicoccus sp. SDUM812003]|uniref:serine hydrolase domain-containing protein n=1 Tax=Pelagicoccus sp. SDUM812003 TaxID=3041267 RepID=UPI00280E4DD9|nr:serine hydrolase domain-containing protein [Pelagicoccus sp. SDUM812003]MDQ8202215.1 serine hydrolase [Pelagicoccus sp. SDUM812003]
MLKPDLQGDADLWHSEHQQPNEGISLGEISGGALVYASAGAMGTGGPEVDERTLFEIGSITKVFTGILLADTVLQGKAELNDSIGQHLPESVLREDSPLLSVTLLQLATHTAGLPSFPDNRMDDMSAENGLARYTREMMFSYLSEFEKEDFENVGTYSYSNFGFSLLAEILAIIHGTDYETLLDERIFSPLGMDSTWVQVDETSGSEALRSRFAKGHRAGEEVLRWNFQAFAGGGAVVSSVEDMLLFAEAHWSESTPDHMKEALAFAMKPRSERMGLGWHIRGEEFWHTGETHGFRSSFRIRPEQQYCIVSLSNSSAELVETEREGSFSSIEGFWSGSVVFGVDEFRLVMHVTSKGDANVFSINHGGALLPNSSASFDRAIGDFVAMYPSLNGRYEATLVGEELLSGIWMFGGDQPLEMTFSEDMPDSLKVVFENIYLDDISPLEGYWSGVMESVDKRFVSIEVAPIAGRFQAMIWGARDMPLPVGVSKVAFDPQKGELRIEAAENYGVFEGALSLDGKSFEGVWTQVESDALKLTWTENRPDDI